METHYTVSEDQGINIDKLDIFGDGTVQAFSFQGILTTTQQDSLIQLFSGFSQYDPNYSGNVTDADYHTIVYIYEGKTKTVAVYAPSAANIPESLRNILTYLDALRSQVIFN